MTDREADPGPGAGEPDVGPWGERPWGREVLPDGTQAPPPHVPFFTAPWQSFVIVAAVLISYAWQATLGGRAQELTFQFAPIDLERGRWWAVFTVILVHAGWAHAIMNALAALAFGPPVARLLGRSPMGIAAFFVFYLVCGGFGSLGVALLHIHSEVPVVGASGAIAGLMGGAARLMGGAGDIQPWRSRPFLSFALNWVLVNAILAVFGVTPFMSGARIAWEAHIAGFAAGALLLEPFLRLSQSLRSR